MTPLIRSLILKTQFEIFFKPAVVRERYVCNLQNTVLVVHSSPSIIAVMTTVLHRHPLGLTVVAFVA